MIHKFVLERCVHCNLPLEALEQSGWDCNGHSLPPSEEEPLWDLDKPLPDAVDQFTSPSTAKVWSYDLEPPEKHFPLEAPSRGRPSETPPRVTEIREPQKTDIFAVICFSTGLLGFWVLPILFTPVSFISGIISYYRLKEDPNLKGKGLRLAGAILASLSMVWLFLQFRQS